MTPEPPLRLTSTIIERFDNEEKPKDFARELEIKVSLVKLIKKRDANKITEDAKSGSILILKSLDVL
jgi:hypothetical protein